MARKTKGKTPKLKVKAEEQVESTAASKGRARTRAEQFGVLKTGARATPKARAKTKVRSNSGKVEADEETRRFASFPKLNPHPVLELSSAGEIKFFNEATINILKKLHLGEDARLFLPRDLEKILKALERRERIEFRRLVHIKDRIFGEVIYLIPEFDTVRIYAHDITGRVQAEKALRESEAKYRSLFAGLTSGFAYHQILLNKNGQPVDYVFLEINGAYGRLTGLKRDDIIGKRVTEVIPGIENDPADWIGTYGKVALTGEEIRFESYSEALQKWYSISAYSPGKGYFVAVFDDVTQRKHVEEALRASEERYRSLVKMSPDAVFVSRNNRIEFANPAALVLFGATSAEQILGKSAFEIFHPSYHAIMRKQMEILLKGKSVPLIDGKIVQLNGTVRDVEVAKAPFDDTEGPAIQVVLRDITGRRWAEERLREAKEALEKVNEQLEIRVSERTAELHKAFKEVEAFFNSTITPLVFLDRDFNFIKVNEAYATSCKRDVSEFPGRNHFEFFPHEENEEIFKKVVETKVPYEAVAKPFVYQDYPEWGITYWDWTLTPILDEHGEVDFLVFSLNDVTERKRTENALEAERQRLFSVLEQIPAYVCLMTSDHKFAYFNQEFKRRFGDPGDRRCHEYLFGLQQSCEGCEAFRIFTENLEAHRWEWTGPDGKTYATYYYPFTDIDGSTLILQMGLDISDRKRAEEQLQKSEYKYRMLIEQAADGIVLLDLKLNIVDVNSTACDMTGFAREELLRLNALDLYQSEPGSRPLDFAELLSGETVIRETRAVKKDGSPVQVEISAKLIEGNLIQAIVRDTTGRKIQERRNRLVTELLELFAKKTSRKEYLDSVVQLIRDWAGCRSVGIRVVNKKRYLPYDSYTGFSPEFMKLENMISLDSDACACIRVVAGKFEPQDASALTPAGSFRLDNSIQFASRLRPNEIARFRGNCIRSGYASISVTPIRYLNQPLGAIHIADEKEGMVPLETVRFLELTAAPLIGEAIHRFNMEAEIVEARKNLEIRVRERTKELAEMAEELKSSNVDLQQFAYAASHDLQEPLRVVAGFVKLIEKRYRDRLDEKGLEYIEYTIDGVRRMQALIKDLLEYSQLGTKGKTFKPTNTSVALEAAIYNLHLAIEENNVALTYDLLPTVMADSSQLTRLFQNLIGNAIKFRGSEPPKIHISAEPKRHQWIFSVKDNGVGIDPKQFERIFVVFQRLHTREEFEGTGIGLSICKKIVEHHGGHIWVESEPGKGSTFYFSMPVMKQGQV